MHAVVVDDHDMAITHIIRGDDHLTNAARQKQIYDALGWRIPEFAHIPLIHGPDGAKLSKRHGALGVDAYRLMGYRPIALRNYLVRLGWSHGDQEIFSTDEMVAAFDLAAVGRSPARFDFAKLENLNGHYMRQADDAELLAEIEALLPDIGPGLGAPTALSVQERTRFLAAMPGLKERAKTLVELMSSAYFVHARRPLTLDEKAKGILSDAARERLHGVARMLADLGGWSASSTEAAVRAFAETAGLKLGEIAQPLRAALTGRGSSPGLFDVMALLGKDECLGRISDQARAPVS
jgi:glutamyl-tRNA synthetase